MTLKNNSEFQISIVRYPNPRVRSWKPTLLYRPAPGSFESLIALTMPGTSVIANSTGGMKMAMGNGIFAPRARNAGGAFTLGALGLVSNVSVVRTESRLRYRRSSSGSVTLHK